MEITSTVNASRLSLRDKLVLTVTMTFHSFLRYDPLTPAPVEGFDIVWASRMIRRNPTISTTIRDTFIGIPLKTGVFEVGKPININKDVTVPVHTIEVIDGPPLLDQKDPESYHALPWEDSAIFLTSAVSSYDPYVGEQVTVTFEHCDNIHDTESKFLSPSMVGFYIADLLDHTDDLKKIDGAYYWSSEYRTALFPSRPGELTIGKGELKYSLKKGINRQWGVLYSPPITLNAKPLPEKGKPSNFSGVVGEYTLTASAYPIVAAPDDEITLKVTVEGRGNVGMISSIEEPDLSSFNIYDKSEKETISNKYDYHTTVGGTKTLLYSMTSLASGITTIEPFSLSYFNPKDRKYHRVTTKPIIIKIVGDTQKAVARRNTTDSRSVIKNVASDIRYIKPDKQILTSANSGVHTLWYFIVLYILPPTVFVMSAALKKRHDLRAHDRTLIRRKAAWKNARRLFDEASKLLDDGDIRGCYGAIQTGIVSFIEDRLDLLPGMVNSLSLSGILSNRGVPQQLSGQVGRFVELCNRIEFSSDGFQTANHRQTLDDAFKLIKELKETI